MDRVSRERISMARLLLICSIIWIHLPPLYSLNALGTSVPDTIQAFFSHGVFRAAVPLLTAISAYIIFASGLHGQPVRLWRKKISTLVVPLLIWNIPSMLVIFLTQKFGWGEHVYRVSLYPLDPVNWVNALTGLTASPANYPLYFLRDLFALV